MGIASPNARWRDVALGLVVGELVATLLFVLPLWALWWLGLAPHATAASTLMGWPYPFAGPWSVVTDLTVLFVLAAAGAAVVASLLRLATGCPVSTVRTAAILLVCGGVPLAWNNGVLQGLIGFVAAVAGIRAFAVGATARRLRGRPLAAAAALVAVLLTSAVGFVLLHPLRVTGYGGPGAVVVFGTGSPFSVRVTAVEPHEGALPPWWGAFGPVDVRIGPRGSAPVALRPRACPRRVFGDATVGVVSVTYVTLGRTERQLVALSPPLRLHCP